jgi:hypothetical protein
MKRELTKLSAICSNRRGRRATSMLEVIVALTLLVSVLSLSVSLIVRHARLLTAQRHYRQALDELSNQMDRITALPADDVAQTLKQLSPTQFAAARLQGAELSAEVNPADIGQRVTLRLTWNEPHEHSVSMSSWIFPRNQARSE